MFRVCFLYLLAHVTVAIKYQRQAQPAAPSAAWLSGVAHTGTGAYYIAVVCTITCYFALPLEHADCVNVTVNVNNLLAISI